MGLAWQCRQMPKQKPLPGLQLRVTLFPGAWIGPGKADLLEGIAETGSIAAAGRRMKMSYKRAWSLIETMNACLREPVVETSRGGQERGGARLTPTGEQVLARYRRIMEITQAATAGEVAALRSLADISDET